MGWRWTRKEKHVRRCIPEMRIWWIHEHAAATSVVASIFGTISINLLPLNKVAFARDTPWNLWVISHARLQAQIFPCLLISLTFISCRTSSSPSTVCGFLGLTARRLISSSSLELQVALIGNMHSGLRKRCSRRATLGWELMMPAHRALPSSDLDLNSV